MAARGGHYADRCLDNITASISQEPLGAELQNFTGT